MTGATRELVDAVAAIDVTTMGQAERTAVGALLLDFLGVAWRGSQTESARVFRAAMGVDESAGAAVVLGTGATASPVAAAMSNAVAGHSIEYDDVHNASSTHPGVVIFPVALALVDADTDTDTFVRAVVAGYETLCRSGRAANPAGVYARHLHPTPVFGTAGAAVTASMLLGLDADATLSAVGIATTGAGGSLQFLDDGAWTKRLHPALAARAGIEAATLARAGYVGTTDGIAGSQGLLAAASELADPKVLLLEWGTRPLEVANTSVKAHTCCRYNQGPIDATLALRNAHAIDAEEVRAVTVGLPSVAVDIVAEPAPAKRRPTSVVDAQFSLPFGIASALVTGQSGLAVYAPEVITAPAVRRVMDTVSYEPDPAIDANYPQEWRAWVRIELADGRRLSSSVNDPKGDPTNPLTPDELRAKFASLTEDTMHPDQAAALADAASAVGAGGSVRAVLAALV